MELGLDVGYLTGDVGAASGRVLALARVAEEAGFGSVWVGEAYGTDAVSVLGLLAGATSRIGLGSAVLQVPARAAAMTAMTAATLDGISGGRFRLGLGVSGPQVAQGWYGRSFAKPLARTREYVAVVRRTLAREASGEAGIRLQQPAPRADLPVLLAAAGPRNAELAGEIADGWLPPFLVPERSAEQFARVRAGFAHRTAPVEDFQVVVPVPLVVTDATGQGRTAAELPVRRRLALYLGGMGSREQNFYADLGRQLGFSDSVDEVQDHYLAGRYREAAAAVAADLLEASCLVGSAAYVRRRLDDHARAGVTTVALVPMGADPAADLRAVA